jgi:ABC-type Mn2+/Zn2+ transport system ATPase subunit
MNNAPIISTQNLSVSYGKEKALRAITLDIREGDLVAVIGPNGSGKTTLIKAMMGLIPYHGRITVCGKTPARAARDIGYVPQRFTFDITFPLTVRELMDFSQQNKNPARVRMLLKDVEMEPFQHKQLGELSGGQLQRVLIARSLLDDPRVLFLDEPTTGVDREGEKDFYDIIRHLHQDHHVTIVMVSHEINVVYAYATQIVCLNRDLLCFGTPKESITREVLKKLYGEDFEIKAHTHHIA